MSSLPLRSRRVTGESEESLLREFVRPRSEACFFILSNLNRFGAAPPTPAPDSQDDDSSNEDDDGYVDEEIRLVRKRSIGGTYFLVFLSDDESEREVVGAFAIFGNGNVMMTPLAESACHLRNELGTLVLGTLDPIIDKIAGVIGSYEECSSVRAAFVNQGVWSPSCLEFQAKGTEDPDKESLWSRSLSLPDGEISASVRLPVPADFETYFSSRKAYMVELELPGDPQREDQERRFAAMLENRTLIVTDAVEEAEGSSETFASTAAITAMSEGTGVVGGVYTRPEHRRKGLSRQTMCGLFRHSREELRLSRLILFTMIGSPAEKLYRSLGFEQIGFFALMWKT